MTEILDESTHYTKLQADAQVVANSLVAEGMVPIQAARRLETIGEELGLTAIDSNYFAEAGRSVIFGTEETE